MLDKLPPCRRDANVWTWTGYVPKDGWTIDFFFSPAETFRADHPILEWCAEREIALERHTDISGRIEFIAVTSEITAMEFKLAWC